MQYGVQAERIYFTGFPLPQENVANAAEDLRGAFPSSMRGGHSAMATAG